MADEGSGRLGKAPHGRCQRVRGLQSGIAEDFDPFLRPWPVPDAGAGEVDHSIHAIQDCFVQLALGGVPGEFTGRVGEPAHKPDNLIALGGQLPGQGGSNHS